MSKKTVYNFLELEFKKLYDDMKIFIENKELRTDLKKEELSEMQFMI